MINTAPISSYPLNTFAIEEKHDPIFIVEGESFRWSAIVVVGGSDVSDHLTGSVLIDREEGAAGIAELELFYPVGSEVEPDLVDRSVTIDYVSDDGQGSLQSRLFTGVVAEPSWDAKRRVMKIIATDNLQNKVEALDIAQIDGLTGGLWSQDIFAPVSGRSHWDYAQERMSSRRASLDMSAAGEIRVTPWKAEPIAHYVFPDGSSVYGTLDIQLAQLRNITNRVEIELSYRYSRLHEGKMSYSWVNPETGGVSGTGGFCNWRVMSTELPDKSMVLRATKGASLVPVSASWYELPPTTPDPCGNGQPWINNQEGLLLGASWTGVRRWVQTVTENYNMTLTTSVGAQEGHQVITRSGYSFIDESAYTADWSTSAMSIDPDDAPPLNPSSVAAGDQHNEDRRVAAIECALHIGAAEIAAAHRETRVSWKTPTSMAVGVDLSHTVQFSEQCTRTLAKCSRRVDELNFENGSAITSLTLSVMRGGGVSDQLVAPQRLGDSDQLGGGDSWGAGVSLPSQLGGRFTSPAYSDEIDGFAGNYTAVQDSTLEVFPRRMAITAPEIDAALVDEKIHNQKFTYAVGVDNNLLEI